MCPFPKRLTVNKKNTLDSYLPIRNRDNNFTWKSITETILRYQTLGLQEFSYHDEQFKNDCKTHFSKKLDDPSFWSMINDTYFKTQAIYKIPPVFLLLPRHRENKSEANNRMIKLFSDFLNSTMADKPDNFMEEKLNFIERDMLTILYEKLRTSEKTANDQTIKNQPYLPYIKDMFLQDISFLFTYPHYLLQESINVFKFYAFIYCSQLALNICSWKNGTPKAQPLYFILDTEKASSERSKLSDYGYKLLQQKSANLFPLLSALEVLQHPGHSRRPLWHIYKETIKHPDPVKLVDTLNNYLQEFSNDRELLDHYQPKNSVEDAFEQFIYLAMKQFEKGRKDVNQKYINEFRKQICGDFIQFRGRAGNVLVLKQDQLLLLTNIAIGRKSQLRLSELITSFQQRGVYFDNQSQEKLVNFYENVGNTERMSDSGDAVYVRKTI